MCYAAGGLGLCVLFEFPLLERCFRQTAVEVLGIPKQIEQNASCLNRCVGYACKWMPQKIEEVRLAVLLNKHRALQLGMGQNLEGTRCGHLCWALRGFGLLAWLRFGQDLCLGRCAWGALAEEVVQRPWQTRLSKFQEPSQDQRRVEDCRIMSG